MCVVRKRDSEGETQVRVRSVCGDQVSRVTEAIEIYEHYSVFLERLDHFHVPIININTSVNLQIGTDR